jgi:acyltransferase
LSLSRKSLNPLSRFRPVLIPYFSFAILSFLYWAVLERNFRGMSDISLVGPALNILLAQATEYGYVYNCVLWFLPCYIVVILLFSMIHWAGRNNWVRMLLLLPVVTLGVHFFSVFEQRPPWMLDSAMVALFFYASGFYFRPVWNRISIPKKFCWAPAVICFTLLFFAAMHNEPVSMVGNNYGNPWLFFGGSLIGILGTVFVSQYSNRVIAFIGLNSLTFMCIHDPIKRIVLKALQVATSVEIEFFQKNIWLSLLTTAIALLVCTPVVLIINRYFGFLIGCRSFSPTQ